MQTTRELISRAKLRQGEPTNYRLARLLNVTSQAISNWKSGRSHPDDAIGARLAVLAGDDPESVIAELHAQRAPTLEGKALWIGIAKRLRDH